MGNLSKIKRLFRIKTIFVLGTIVAVVSLLLAYLAPFVHPSTFKILPLFGLSYWLIILVNLLFLIIWTFLRSKWALLILTALFLGGKLHFRTFSFGWGGQKNEQHTTELNVLSYNVRLFDLYDPSKLEGIKTRNKIFDFLKSTESDIYCIQEYYHQEPPTRFKTKDTLMDILGTPYFHARTSASDWKRQEFGIAIFSKYPIIRQGEVSFSSINKTNNYCIYVDIVKQSDTFRVYNVHFQSIRLQKDDYEFFNDYYSQAGEEDSQIFRLTKKIKKAFPVRANQAIKVAEHIKGSPFPVIVCGDFNDSPMSYCYNQFASQLVDAFRNTSFGVGKTYAGRVPAGRIDYIFHDKSLGSCNFIIQKEKLSDHYGIQCTLFPLK